MIKSVVFDTNVLISATLWDSSVAQKLFFKLMIKDIKIFSSQEIIEEYRKILSRDFDYSEKEIKDIIEKILQFISLVKQTKKVSIVEEDPDDNKIIECAIESQADYIFTYDNHLLKLKEYQNIKIIRPEDILWLL